MNLKLLLLLVIGYCPLIAQIKAECILKTAEDISVRPKFFRNIRTATTLISNEYQNITLNHEEIIIGHCANGFVNPNNFEYRLDIWCNGTSLQRYNVGYRYLWPSNTVFECAPYGEFHTCPRIHLSSNTALRPNIFKKIGTRNIQLSPEKEIITMQYHQEITAQCNTKFKSPNPPIAELNLVCINDGIIALDHPFRKRFNNFECELSKWKLYEPKTPFPWCPSSMESYILTRPLQHNIYEYLAGICYDFDHMTLKSLYYAAKPIVQNLMPRVLESFEPQMEISDVITTFNSKRSFVYDNPNMQKWISLSNYKTDSIVQYRRLHIDLSQQFDQMLNIDWWNTLKLGNWQLYEEALAKHIDSENNDYDILAGVSNKVAVPMGNENSSQNITMVEAVDTENNRLPLYVWNYLRSLNSSNDDVVVIGVNTPFADFYDEKELMFCNDICHTIDWLKDVHMTFRYRSMGLIFCCTFNEVLASMRLDGFMKP